MSMAITFHNGLGVTDIRRHGAGGGGGGGGSEASSITSKFTTNGGVWYDFNPGPNDSGPLGLNLTPVNNPSYANDGRPQQCANLQVTMGQYFTHPHSTVFDLSLSNGLTIGGWAYPIQFGGFRRIISKGATTAPANLEYSLMINNTAPQRWRFLMSTGTAYVEVLSTETITLNTWTFVVAQYLPGGTMRIRTNNNAWASTSITNPVNGLTVPLFIGSSSQGGTHTWDGMLDGIFLVRDVLTDAEINYIYNSGNGRNWI